MFDLTQVVRDLYCYERMDKDEVKRLNPELWYCEELLKWKRCKSSEHLKTAQKKTERERLLPDSFHVGEWQLFDQPVDE